MNAAKATSAGGQFSKKITFGGRQLISVRLPPPHIHKMWIICRLFLEPFPKTIRSGVLA